MLFFSCIFFLFSKKIWCSLGVWNKWLSEWNEDKMRVKRMNFVRSEMKERNKRMNKKNWNEMRQNNNNKIYKSTFSMLNVHAKFLFLISSLKNSFLGSFFFKPNYRFALLIMHKKYFNRLFHFKDHLELVHSRVPFRLGTVSPHLLYKLLV